MIKTETLPNNLVRTYSDTFHKIIQDGTGIVYDEAIDPADKNRTYTESEEYIDGYSDDATEEDYVSALAELGVE